jgi:hypothetical protein
VVVGEEGLAINACRFRAHATCRAYYNRTRIATEHVLGTSVGATELDGVKEKDASGLSSRV